MTTSTKKILFISLFLFLVISIIAGFGFYEIIKQGKNLEEQKVTLIENKNKEAEFFSIQRLLRETEGERDFLAENFFRDQNDIVIFLDNLDKLALDFNLTLDTESLEKTESEDGQLLTKISFSFSGNKNRVMGFSELLENIPYLSFIESLNLKQTDGGVWKGKTILVVTMNSL